MKQADRSRRRATVRSGGHGFEGFVTDRHQLHYRDNDARLRQVKPTWDPRNVFRHALSIEPAA